MSQTSEEAEAEKQKKLLVFTGPMNSKERRSKIYEVFPSTASLNWKKALDNDPDILGRMLRDILKLDQLVPGRPGTRSLDQTRAEPTLDRMMGRDPTERPYSLLPFNEAFRLLLGKRSMRSAQAKFGLSKSKIHRFLNGTADPTAVEMETIASALGKAPSFFLEYRVRSITSSIHQSLQDLPEESIPLYEKMWRR